MADLPLISALVGAGVDGEAACVNAAGTRFDDGKAVDAFRTIGEVAQALGLRPHVLRYWEDQFPMLRPVKRKGGRRYYRPADVALLEAINRLVHREGYTLRGARQWLEAGERLEPSPSARILETVAPAPTPSRHTGTAHIGSDRATTQELLAIRAILASALHEAG